MGHHLQVCSAQFAVEHLPVKHISHSFIRSGVISSSGRGRELIMVNKQINPLQYFSQLTAPFYYRANRTLPPRPPQLSVAPVASSIIYPLFSSSVQLAQYSWSGAGRLESCSASRPAERTVAAVRVRPRPPADRAPPRCRNEASGTRRVYSSTLTFPRQDGHPAAVTRRSGTAGDSGGGWSPGSDGWSGQQTARHPAPTVAAGRYCRRKLGD